ncbi:MAG: tetratricopeptide repeat protein [Dehalococcoidia bacterium]|nr:tetratricopeptide repeat protein [Dehalococcoidia bacterium]
MNGEAQAHYEAGLYLQAQERFEEAIAEFDRAIRLDRKLVAAYNKRGDAYFTLGQVKRAAKDYDQALRLDRQSTHAYVHRGSTHLILGKPKRALEDLDRAISIDPGLATAYRIRGSAYAQLGNYERAIQDYDQAINLDPTEAPSYLNRGNAVVNMRGHLGLEQAIGDYDEALRLDPHHDLAYMNRGKAYLELGRFERALRTFTGDDVRSDRPEPEYFQLALQDLNRPVRLAPKASAAYAVRAGVFAVLGRDAEAQMDVRRAVDLGVNRAALEQQINEAKELATPLE